MRFFFALATLLLAHRVVANPLPATSSAIPLEQGRVLILGDSITQDGFYVSLFEYYLQKAHPNSNFDILSLGLSSENTTGLTEPGHANGAFPRPNIHDRLARTLAAVKPDIVLACYGMNDGIYLPLNDERMNAFQQGISRLVQDCRKAGSKVILITPPVFEPRKSTSPSYDDTLRAFAQWETQHPPEGTIAVIDLHSDMTAARDDFLRDTPSFRFTRDQIHPGPLGHLIMARSLLRGLNIPIPELLAQHPEQALAAAQADPLFQLVHQRRALRSDAWLKHIGYTRERHVPPGSGNIEKSEARAKELQSEINRLRANSP